MADQRTGIICKEKCQSKLEYKRAIKDAKKFFFNRNKQKVALSAKEGINSKEFWHKWKQIMKGIGNDYRNCNKNIGGTKNLEETYSGFKNYFVKCFVNFNDNVNLKNTFF